MQYLLKVSFQYDIIYIEVKENVLNPIVERIYFMKVQMITEVDKRRILSNTKSQIRYSLKANFDHAIKTIIDEGGRIDAIIDFENAHTNMYWYVSGVSRTLLAISNVTIEEKEEIEGLLKKEVERLYRRYNKMIWDAEIPTIEKNNY